MVGEKVEDWMSGIRYNAKKRADGGLDMMRHHGVQAGKDGLT